MLTACMRPCASAASEPANSTFWTPTCTVTVAGFAVGLTVADATGWVAAFCTCVAHAASNGARPRPAVETRPSRMRSRRLSCVVMPSGG